MGVSHIEVGLAGVAGASSRVPFVDGTEESCGSGYDADTVLAVRYGVQGDYERAVIDFGTGEEPSGTVPRWPLLRSKGNGLVCVNRLRRTRRASL